MDASPTDEVQHRATGRPERRLRAAFRSAGPSVVLHADQLFLRAWAGVILPGCLRRVRVARVNGRSTRKRLTDCFRMASCGRLDSGSSPRDRRDLIRTARATHVYGQWRYAPWHGIRAMAGAIERESGKPPSA